MIKVIQVVLNRENNNEVIGQYDVTDCYKGQWIGVRDIINCLENKRDTLAGKKGNVYHNIVGIDYKKLNIPEELKQYIGE